MAELLIQFLSCLLGAACALLLGCSQPLAQQADTDESATSISKLWQDSRQRIESGEYDQAIKLCREIVARQPDRLDAILMLGDAYFMSGDMAQSIASYDRAIDMKPGLGPRMWQRGLALYFAKKYELGRRQFESHQSVNQQDVENAVWHLMCNSKLVALKQARQKLIPIRHDTRIPMPQIYDMFAGRGSVEEVLTAAQELGPDDPARKKVQSYYAHLYVGLFHEMMGRKDQAIRSMKQAARVNPIPKNQLMGSVADVYLKLNKE